MRRVILAGLVAALAAGPVLAQSQPASGPRDRVEREREEREAAGGERGKRSREERPRRRPRSGGGGQVVVVPPSELSSSGDRTRSAEGPGVTPRSGPITSFQPLIGADEAGLKRAIGDPATARDEGQGAMWTYRMQTCALHVFLSRDQAGVMRVKGAASGPLRRGAPTPAVDACVAEAKRP